MSNDLAARVIDVNVSHSFKKAVFCGQRIERQLILTDDMTGSGIAKVGGDGDGALVELLSHGRSR